MFFINRLTNAFGLSWHSIGNAQTIETKPSVIPNGISFETALDNLVKTIDLSIKCMLSPKVVDVELKIHDIGWRGGTQTS